MYLFGMKLLRLSNNFCIQISLSVIDTIDNRGKDMQIKIYHNMVKLKIGDTGYEELTIWVVYLPLRFFADAIHMRGSNVFHVAAILCGHDNIGIGQWIMCIS